MIKKLSFSGEDRKELLELFKTSEWTKTAGIPFYSFLDCIGYIEEKKIIGAILYKKYKRKPGGKITFIVVAPEYYKKGIAKKMIRCLNLEELNVDIAQLNGASFACFNSMYALNVVEKFITKQGMSIIKYHGVLRTALKMKKLF